MERSSLHLLSQVQTLAQFKTFLTQAGLDPLARLLSRPGAVLDCDRILLRQALEGIRNLLASLSDASKAEARSAVLKPLLDKVDRLVPGLVDLVVLPISSLRSVRVVRDWRTEAMKEDMRTQAVAMEILYALVLGSDNAVEVSSGGMSFCGTMQTSHSHLMLVSHSTRPSKPIVRSHQSVRLAFRLPFNRSSMSAYGMRRWRPISTPRPLSF